MHAGHDAIPPLRVVPVSRIAAGGEDEPAFLIDRLWAVQAVGLIGGAPKCGKSWLALEMALSVASGRPCLGVFAPRQTGNVLLYAAEDAPPQVRLRLAGLAQARGVDFSSLAVHVILEPQLRLDLPQDRQRLENTLAELQPRLLILDPFVRLHRIDENSAAEVSALLADLRSLQRRFAVAIILVHHTRKANGEVSGPALRGSSDLHAWGDSNLYLRRHGENLVLSMEHRASRPGEPLTLRLADAAGPPRLERVDPQESPKTPDLSVQVLALLCNRGRPVTQEAIREALQVRNQRLTEILTDLRDTRRVIHGPGGWSLPAPPAR
ncbi:MAG: AAA family ATPase [candidate division NC10 bacterium]